MENCSHGNVNDPANGLRCLHCMAKDAASSLNLDLKVLRAFLVKEAEDYVQFLNGLQDRRTADYKARGDADANYAHLSGIEETKYWPFIQIVDRAIAATP